MIPGLPSVSSARAEPPEPYLGVDPWRWQYFEGEPCPDDVVVPIDDATGWTLYPRHRWVYNKLLICETQRPGVRPARRAAAFR